MILKKIKNSFLFYNENHDIHTKEYYDYIVLLLINMLNECDSNLNVIFGPYNHLFNNQNKTIKIDIQCEHTLVKDSGRGVDNFIYGKVPHEDGNYLIRIDKYEYLNNLDSIIDYSLPNLYNISTNENFIKFLNKSLYISPLLYNVSFDNQNKTETIVLFNPDNNKRRQDILNHFTDENININIITNCYDKKCLNDQYRKTKLMINIHQTEHHHTFEELRVLPCLLNGVIIISENVPLKDKIPYSDFIIWCDYGEIVNKTKDVIKNYEKYYKNIFVNSNILKVLDEIKKKNNLTYEGSIINGWVS